MAATAQQHRIGRMVDDSNLLDHAVRVGLVSYGVQHLLIAWLALKLAFGERSGKASSSGALHELAQSGLGQASLYVVAAGFAALVVWQALEAAVGHRDEDGGKRVWKRAVSGFKVVLYGTLGISALKVATGSSSKGGTDTWTAKLMSAPAGQILVGVVGVIILVVAGFLIHRGWTEKFRSKLDVDGRTGHDGRAYVLFGKAGYLSKGVALVIVGGLFLYAAWTHDPKKSGGLDAALTQLLDQPFGTPLLAVMAVGIACYGLFCFAWAKHLDR